MPQHKPVNSEPPREQVTLADASRRIAATLRRAGLEDPLREARRLVTEILGIDAVRLITADDEPLGPSLWAQLHEAAGRRAAGEPLSRIVGHREFYGRRFEVSPATLDPRADTETLVEAVLAMVAMQGPRGRALRILDVGTGSGCLAITLVAELQGATALATDISEDALATARRNAAGNGVSGRIAFECRDMLSGISAQFDVMVSNPPYIRTADIDRLDPAVRLYDPSASLDGGADGLDFYRQLTADAARLVPSGFVAFEVGAGQAAAVAELGEGHGLGAPVFHMDLNGHTRCVAFQTLVC